MIEGPGRIGGNPESWGEAKYFYLGEIEIIKGPAGLGGPSELGERLNISISGK